MFRGSSIAKIDSKGRFKMPSDFRRVLEESWGPDCFLTSVQGDVGLFYPLPVWEGIEGRLLDLPANDRSRQRYLQRVSYFGQQSCLDAQGRLVIAPVLREAADLNGEVVVCGSADHLQIWNRDRFLSKLDAEPFTDDDFADLAEKGI